MGQFDPKERYKRLDLESDTFLDRLKASKWTPLILLAFVVAVITLAFLLA